MKRKNILICGYYGFANAGDEAMLMAVIEALNKMHSNLAITVLSGNPTETSTRYGVNAIHRFNLFAIFLAMLKADLVISGGGSLLQDVTSKRSIFYYLGIMQMAKLLFKKVMLYGQGIGPIRGSLAKKLTGFVCRQVNLIAVRDKKSQDVLLSFGIAKNKIFLTADPVMSMQKVDKCNGKMILRKVGIENANMIVGICPRDWQGLSSFKNVLAVVADSLIKKYNAKIVFLPLQYPDDLNISKQIVDLMQDKENVAIISHRYSISDCLSLVGNMQMMISIRLHALIFAAVMGTPVVGISYDPKVDGFLENIDSTCVGNLSNVTSDDIIQKVDEIIKNPEILQNQNQKVEKLRKSALENAILASKMLS